MFASEWRDRLLLGGGSRKLRCRGAVAHAPSRFMLTLSHPTVVQDLRVLKDLVETEHRPTRHVFVAHALDNFRARHLLKLVVQDAAKLFHVVDTLTCGGVARVIAQLGSTDRPKQRMPFIVTAGPCDDVTVRGFGESIPIVERWAFKDAVAQKRVLHHPIGKEEGKTDIEHRD